MSNNIGAGSVHIRALLNAALESETGVMVKGLERGKAVYVRGLLHSIRNAERKKSMKAKTINDPSYGTCVYDVLVTELIPGEASLTDLRIIRSDKLACELRVVDEKSGKDIDLKEYL